jgi:septum site-determining protein MinC
MPVKNRPVFQLQGSVFTLTVLQLLSENLGGFSAQVQTLIEKNPGFFQHIPIIVDLQKLPNADKLDFEKLNTLLRNEGFTPIAIRGGSAEQQKRAVLAGWAILNHMTHVKSDKETDQQTLPESPPENFATIITQPVRSGQQIYAQNKDLIVLAAVSNGAELIADGHIHVYGPLRGRALAGVKGNQQARIFCQSLEAELVAIAGHYWVNEDGKKPETNKGTQIYLQDDHLHMVDL